MFEKGFWKGIPVEELSTPHIRNIINFIKRNEHAFKLDQNMISAYESAGIDWDIGLDFDKDEKIEEMEIELKRRGVQEELILETEDLRLIIRDLKKTLKRDSHMLNDLAIHKYEKLIRQLEGELNRRKKC